MLVLYVVVVLVLVLNNVVVPLLVCINVAVALLVSKVVVYAVCVAVVVLYSVVVLLFVSILMGAAFWEDASLGFHYLDDGAKKLKQPSQALHWSALLHCMAAICLTVHLLIPRRWLIRMTDDIIERVPEK